MILENLRILKQSKTKNVNCKTFQNKCGLIKRVWDLKFVNFHITKSISFNSYIMAILSWNICWYDFKHAI